MPLAAKGVKKNLVIVGRSHKDACILVFVRYEVCARTLYDAIRHGRTSTWELKWRMGRFIGFGTLLYSCPNLDSTLALSEPERGFQLCLIYAAGNGNAVCHLTNIASYKKLLSAGNAAYAPGTNCCKACHCVGDCNVWWLRLSIFSRIAVRMLCKR